MKSFHNTPVGDHLGDFCHGGTALRREVAVHFRMLREQHGRLSKDERNNEILATILYGPTETLLQYSGLLAKKAAVSSPPQNVHAA